MRKFAVVLGVVVFVIQTPAQAQDCSVLWSGAIELVKGAEENALQVAEQGRDWLRTHEETRFSIVRYRDSSRIIAARAEDRALARSCTGFAELTARTSLHYEKLIRARANIMQNLGESLGALTEIFTRIQKTCGSG